MNKRSRTDIETESLQEFCAFVEAAPVSPNAALDTGIIQRVKRDLRPSLGWLYAKLFFIEAGAGIATLSFCPQFGVAIGPHGDILNALHEQTGFALFYLICGLLFVLAGAVLAAMLLSYNELQTIKRSKYLYYLAFGVTAFFAFFVAGGVVLWLSAAPWIVGAYLGNLIGFGVVSRFRLMRWFA